MSPLSIDEELSQLGFPECIEIEGRSSIADIFHANRCGIYVLHFSNGDYYVGQSIDVIKRFAQHRHTYNDIQKISFKKTRKDLLNESERFTVQKLENLGCRLRNIQIVSFSYGETDFDLIMSAEDQERWLSTLNYQDLVGDRIVNEDLRNKYTKRFHQFRSLPYAGEVIDVLREYVRNCIPAVKRGEVAFWSISCLPDKSKKLRARINVGWQTTFDAWVIDGKCYFDWYLTRSLAEQVFGLSLVDVSDEIEVIVSLDEYPNLEIEVTKSPLVKGGEDQVFVSVEGTAHAIKLIHDPYKLSAVRLFNLGLVQKGPCPWGKNHCLDLADHLI